MMDKEKIYATLNECYFSEDCHEKDVLENLKRFLKPNGFFVDIGASLGQYTKFAAQHLHYGKIVSIEADPIRYEELERNAVNWRKEFDVTIETIHAAVSNNDKIITFYTTNSNISGGVFPHEVNQNVNWEPISVPAITLDNYFTDKLPDLIKVDIEGGEFKMLLGATRLLSKKNTLFLIELHNWVDSDGNIASEEALKIMKRYNYYPISFHGKTLFVPFGPLYMKEKIYAFLRKLRKLLRQLVHN